MRSVGIRELKEQASQILRQVREERAPIDVTMRGQVIARIVPVEQTPLGGAEAASVWAEIDALAAEIGARWPREVAALDTVNDVRREL